MFHEMPGIY
jgi:hypothetical protein